MNINLVTTKKVLNISAKIGAGTIVSSIVRNNVATSNPVYQVLVFVGSLALASRMSTVAGEEMNALVDEVAAFVNHSDAKIYFI